MRVACLDRSSDRVVVVVHPSAVRVREQIHRDVELGFELSPRAEQVPSLLFGVLAAEDRMAHGVRADSEPAPDQVASPVPVEEESTLPRLARRLEQAQELTDPLLP